MTNLGVQPATARGQEGGMPRKPNYRFERQERDRKKAAKTEEKRKAKELRKASGETGAPVDGVDDEPEASPDADAAPGVDKE